MVWHDVIILIEGEKPHRSLRNLYLRKELYKSYDEGEKIISVFYNHSHKGDRGYRIVQLDTSSKPVTYSYGFGYHNTYKSFEKSYLIPFTKKTLSRFNKNPELIKYLPAKPKNKDISHAFFKRKIDCDPLGPFKYFWKSKLLFLTKFFSAMG